MGSKHFDEHSQPTRVELCVIVDFLITMRLTIWLFAAVFGTLLLTDGARSSETPSKRACPVSCWEPLVFVAFAEADLESLKCFSVHLRY